MPKKQLALISTPTIKELDDAVEQFQDASEKFAKAKSARDSAKQQLIVQLKEHGLKEYRDTTCNPPLYAVIVAIDETVKVLEIEE